jgi:transcriptional regulator with XRE-family HTH domain
MLYGEIVKEIRNELGITQEQLAHALDVSYSTINRWENSHSVPSKLAKIRIIDYCTKLGVSNHVINKIKQGVIN